MEADLHQLARVRLGARERQVLLDAPPRPALTADALAARRDELLDLGSKLARVGNGSGVDLVLRHLESPPELDYSRLLAIGGRTPSERVAVHRAARRLEDHGLLEYWTISRDRGHGDRRTVCVCRTALGDAVVRRFGAQLRSGGRIRWTT